MRWTWRYYFQVIVSGTLLNLYYYTSLFEHTGSVLQTKSRYLHNMDTSTLGERLDRTFRALYISLHRDNSIEDVGRPDVRVGFQPSSLRLNITHGYADSDAGTRIKNYTYQTEETNSQPPSLKYSTHFEQTTSLLRQLVALQVT